MNFVDLCEVCERCVIHKSHTTKAVYGVRRL